MATIGGSQTGIATEGQDEPAATGDVNRKGVMTIKASRNDAVRAVICSSFLIAF